MEYLKYLPKNKLKRIIFAMLTIFWCGMIFCLSSENGDESSETSAGIIKLFCEFIVPEFSGFDGAQRAELVENLQFIVRKCAHFTAYFILSIFSMQFFRTFEKLGKPLHGITCGYAASCAVLFCMVYASTDEIHQIFVSGRSPQVRDVFIDTSGALLSAALQCGIIYIIAKRKSEKS